MLNYRFLTDRYKWLFYFDSFDPLSVDTHYEWFIFFRKKEEEEKVHIIFITHWNFTQPFYYCHDNG